METNTLTYNQDELIKMEEHKLFIFEKYFKNTKYDDINLINIFYSWSPNNNSTIPIYWIKYENLKIIIKDELYRTCENFKQEHFDVISVETLNSNQTFYDTKLFYEKLCNFYRDYINNFPDIFPKFLEETDEFFIFEFIEGTILQKIDFINNNTIRDQYYKKSKSIIDLNISFRLGNDFPFNWVLRDENILFVNLHQFMVIPEPILSPPDFNPDQTILINLKKKKKRNELSLFQ